jgi:EAL domain-containing protein (putative c-di-GMP-specific phosphodiesterase class I)
MSDPQRVTEVLASLRGFGVRLSLDDFGTGHASLAYLKQLPLDQVKIDRAFVTTMADDDGDLVIVRSTIDLARNLGLDVVAEGVETAAQAAFLRGVGTDLLQGYLLGRPLPADEVTALLDRPLLPRAGGGEGGVPGPRAEQPLTVAQPFVPAVLPSLAPPQRR